MRAELLERDYVPARVNVHFEWPAGEKGNERRKVRVFGDNAPPVAPLALEDFTENATTVRAPVGPRRSELLFEPGRDERQSIDLPVRMRHGDADDRALILEDQDVADARGVLQLDEALPPQAHQEQQVAEGKLRK